jgi:hemerythrin-like domain-containing protein
MRRHPSLLALSHDHHHGLALALRCRKQALGQLKPTGTEGLRERAEEVREFFSRNLIAHFRAEEEFLFPEMRRVVPASADLIGQLLAQHDQLRTSVEKLTKQDVPQARSIFDFGDLLEQHIRKEERELFALYEENIALLDAAAVGQKINERLAGSPGSS